MLALIQGLQRNWGNILLLLWGTFGLLYVGISLSIQGRLPSDGTLWTEPSARGIGVTLKIEQTISWLEPGDQILMIDGVSVMTWMERIFTGGDLPELYIGKTVIYHIIRDGRAYEVPVTLRAFPIVNLPFVRGGVYLLAMVSLGFGSYVLLIRRHDILTRLIYISACALLAPLCLHFQLGVLSQPIFFIFEIAYKWLSNALVFSVILHFALLFPTPPAWLAGRAGWLNHLHWINPVLSLAAGRLLASTPLAQVYLTLQISSWIGLGMLALSIVSVMYTYLTISGIIMRNQIRIAALGLLLGVLPYFIFTAVPQLVWGRPFLAIEITAFFVIAVPLSLAAAVFQYRIFDVNTILRRSMLFVAACLLLVGFYFSAMAFVRFLLGRFIGYAHEGIALFITMVIGVGSVWLLRVPLARLGRGFIYHRRPDPNVLLNEMTRQLSGAIRMDDVAELLTVLIPRQIGAAGSGLLVLNDAGDTLEMVGARAYTLPLDAMLTAWRDWSFAPVRRSAPPPDMPVELLQFLEDRAVELLIPLVVGGELVGIWSLGVRFEDSSYETEEINVLAALGWQAAIALENARLVRRLEQNSQRLELEVQRRTQALEGERNQLNAILQTMVDGLLVTNADDQIILVNPALESIVRRGARRLIGASLDGVLAAPVLTSAVARALENPGEVQSVEFTLGDVVLRASAIALGDKSAVITLVRDITRDVELDRMKSEFVSAVSHELRTPVTSILGFSKLTRRTFERGVMPSLPDKKDPQRAARRVARNLDIMVLEGERLTDLINDVLDIAALDAGKMEWRDQPYELPVLIQRVALAHQATAAAKNLALRVEIEGDFPLLRADPARIEQVLSNLVSNALKFTSEGEISVKAVWLSAGTHVHDWVAPLPGAALVSVTDTGIGITPDMFPQLFQRFQQMGDVLHNKPAGTGLGLAISREIITHYGGEIWAESAPGRGTTFSFILPASPTFM